MISCSAHSRKSESPAAPTPSRANAKVLKFFVIKLLHIVSFNLFNDGVSFKNMT